MDTVAILRELEFSTGTFPRQALEEAVAQKEQITPALLEIVEQARRRIDYLESTPNSMALFYALYLLAQFQETRAYRPIVEFFSIPGDITVDLTGDVVSEDLGRILASVCGGDTGLIEGLIENPDASEWVRSAGIDALLVLVASGIKTREEVLAYFRRLFRGKLERQYSYVWPALAIAATALYPEDLLDDIQRAFAEGLVDEGSISLRNVTERVALGKEQLLADLPRRHSLIGDGADELESWACFSEPPPPQPAAPAAERPPVPGAAITPSVGQPARSKKVGRNEPCPCGSGLKYKRCCGR